MKIAATLAPLALLFAACGGNTINTGTSSGASTSSSSSTSSSGSGAVPVPITASVGATGGSVLTTDGSGVTIPAGALAGSVSIAVTPTAASAFANLPSYADLVGTPYVIGPANQVFTAPVTVILAEPAGTASGAVIQFQAANAPNPTTFFPLQTTQVDATHISVQTTQLGTFIATFPHANCGVVMDYPGNACAWGVNVGNTFPNITLNGGAALNFGTTATVDNTSNLAPSFSFGQLQQLSARGFRYAFLDISAVWCPHCIDEANTLPGSYVATWLAQGGIVFSVLVQSGNPDAMGVYPPATVSDLKTWISGHGGGVNYPMSLDTDQNMVTATGLQAWPANLILRLSDMTVVDSVFGATNAFYQEFQNVLLSCQANADCWSGATCTSGQCH